MKGHNSIELKEDVVIHHIRTKNKLRKIVAYRTTDCELRKYHERIAAFLGKRFIPSIFSKGYTKGRSIYHNALSHMYNDYYIMMDIKDFFLNICHKQLIDKVFHEMNLIQESQVSRKDCIHIVDVCSISSRGLPLGFVTSPILSNIYLKEFDCIFYGKLKELGLENTIYTRYADDLVVSFKYSEKEKLTEVETEVVSIATKLLKRYGLRLNVNKNRSYNLNISNHVRITGVNIIKSEGERRLSVGRRIKNQLYWDALECWKNRIPEKIREVKGVQAFILSVEKNGYEGCYSDTMKMKIKELGYSSLKQMIDSL